MKKSFILGFLILAAFMFVLAGCAGNAIKTSEITKCTDSDSGMNYYIKGTITLCTTSKCLTYTDSCGTSGKLSERYCSGKNLKTTTYTCPGGCDMGACKNQTLTCIDSDGGKNWSVRGTITICNNQTGCENRYNDSCYEPTGSVEEGYCSSGTWYASVRYKCTNGCKDGACL